MSNPSRPKIMRILFGLVLLAGLFWVARREGPPLQLNEANGVTMGTVGYNIKALSTEIIPIGFGVDSLLQAFNQSLSTYIPSSELSRFNQLDTLAFESRLFPEVLEASRSVVEATNRAFDPTVGPLVNAWGFGPEGVTHQPDSSEIDSLVQLVDFRSVTFTKDYAAKKSKMYLDFSAIAKGYAVDLVAEYLERQGIDSYMVEIGGEVRTKGKNLEGQLWRIGIEDPLVARDERKLLAIVSLEDRSLATSGNYRNYYEKDGKTYAHIIDPRTGYNNFNSILSASVFAPGCMEADAYATAFMVMGVEESAALVEASEDLEAILIYQIDGELRTYISQGIAEYIESDFTQDSEAG